MTAIRCKCGLYLKKETNSCSRCKIEYVQRETAGAVWFSNGDDKYIVDNNRLVKIIETPKEETKMFFQYDEKQAGGFEMLPAGEYEAMFSDVEVKESKKGAPMIAATLTIRADVDQEGTGRKIFDYLIVGENTMFKFHQVAKALGWGHGEGAADLQDFAEKIIYQEVRLKLKQGKAQDGYEAKNEVVTYLETQEPSGTGGQRPMREDPFVDDGKPIDISDDDLPF